MIILNMLLPLLIGGYLFSVIGVILLLVKTKEQSRQLEVHISQLDRLTQKIQDLEDKFQVKNSAAVQQETLKPVSLTEIDASPVLESPKSSAVSDEEALLPYEAPLNTPENTPESPVPSLLDSIKGFIHGGNLWGAGGVVLLITAFAMLITYFARQGFFTLEMGLAGAAFSGLAMLGLGWRFRARRPIFFLLLQGGGIGVLYLSIFAAYKLTSYFPPVLSLILMSLLIPPTIMLALSQGCQPLAVLGFFGGFAAPILFPTGNGSPLFCFGYYTVLNIGIIIIGYYRIWKGLTLFGFLGTFGYTLFWVQSHYQAQAFWIVECFTLVSMILFIHRGVQSKTKPPIDCLDAALIGGTPLFGVLIHWTTFSYTAVFSHILFSLLFVLLGIALGSLLIFWGLRQTSGKILLAGLALYSTAGITLAMIPVPDYSEVLFRNFRFIGSIIIALSALGIIVMVNHKKNLLVSARDAEPLLPPERDPPVMELTGMEKVITDHLFNFNMVYCALFAVWAFGWWFYGWFFQLSRIVSQPWEVFFILTSLTALGAFGLAGYVRCPGIKIGIIPCLGFAVLKVFVEGMGTYLFYYPAHIFTYNFFKGADLWGWLIFFAVQGILMFFLIGKKNMQSMIEGLWVFMVILVSAIVLTATGRAYTIQYHLAESWTDFAGILPWLGILIVWSLCAKSLTGFISDSAAGCKRLLFFTLPLILCVILGLWFLVMLFFSKNPAPLPFYIPIIDLFNNPQNAMLKTWEGEKRRQRPKRNFLNGCTG